MKILLLLVLQVTPVLGQFIGSPREYKSVVVTPTSETDKRFLLAGIPPGPLRLKAVTLKELIARGYGVPTFEVMGGPEWIGTDRWDFRLELEPAPVSTERVNRGLLQALQDRFNLSAHRENRVVPVYELGLGASGARLRSDPALDDRGPVISSGIGSIRRRNTSMDDFAYVLSLHFGRPVLNRTGLPGLFALALDWAPGLDETREAEVTWSASTPVNPNAPPIFAAIQEQLGLCLTPRERLVNVVVIDRARKPTQ